MLALSDENKVVVIKPYCRSTWCLCYLTDHNRAFIYAVINFSMGVLVVVILGMKWKWADNDPLAEAVKKLSPHQPCVHQVSCMLAGGAASRSPNFSFRVFCVVRCPHPWLRLAPSCCYVAISIQLFETWKDALIVTIFRPYSRTGFASACTHLNSTLYLSDCESGPRLGGTVWAVFWAPGGCNQLQSEPAAALLLLHMLPQ